ncbi:MAG: hypothetical protein LBK99_27355, partial [Opitutaceae bacterium]|nr:hypothetical protein [Opitutaceae bacterium]
MSASLPSLLSRPFHLARPLCACAIACLLATLHAMTALHAATPATPSAPAAPAQTRTVAATIDLATLPPSPAAPERWTLLAELDTPAETVTVNLAIETTDDKNPAAAKPHKTLKLEATRATARTLRLHRWGGGIYLESDGWIRAFQWLGKTQKLAGIEFRLVTSAPAAPRIRIENTPPGSIRATPSPSAQNRPLEHPGQKHILALPLNWMNRHSYRSISRHEYDLSIAPIDADLTWDIRKMRDHGVTAIDFDNLATKRPEAVMSFYGELNRWRAAITDFAVQPGGTPFHYLPFWEYNTTFSTSGDPALRDATADYIADILGFFDAHAGDDPAFLKLTGRPWHLLYNSMYRTPPAFWRRVIERLHATGRHPVLALGPGGIPVTVNGHLNPAELRAYTDNLFETLFLFGLGSTRAHKLPGDIAGVLKTYDTRKPTPGSNNSSSVLPGHRHLVAPVQTGYWSVRQSMQNYADFRHTAYLRDSIKTSLAANPDALHITTWDDWQEQNAFAPSFNNLDSKLDIVDALTARWRGLDPVKTRGAANAAASGSPRVILTYRRTWRPGEPLAIEALALPAAAPGLNQKLTVNIQILDAKKNVLRELVTHPLDPLASEAQLLTLPAAGLANAPLQLLEEKSAFNGLNPGTLTLAVTIGQNGKTHHYANLPPIAIPPPAFFDTDLNYYTIPLHKLAGPERAATLTLNGDATHAFVSGAPAIAIEAAQTPPGGFHWAMTRNGHPFRFMARDGVANIEVTLRRQDSKWAPLAPPAPANPASPSKPLRDTLPQNHLPWPAPRSLPPLPPGT